MRNLRVILTLCLLAGTVAAQNMTVLPLWPRRGLPGGHGAAGWTSDPGRTNWVLFWSFRERAAYYVQEDPNPDNWIYLGFPPTVAYTGLPVWSSETAAASSAGSLRFFSASNQWGLVRTHPLMNVNATGALGTVSAGIRYRMADTNSPHWLFTRRQGSPTWLQIGYYAGLIYYQIGNNTIYAGCTTAFGADTNWHLAVGTYDGNDNTAVLYIDGVRRASSVKDFVLDWTNDEGCEIGCYNKNLYFQNGWLDEPTYWTRALSSNEIAAWASSGTIPAGSVFSFDFAADYPHVEEDLSGSGNDGMIWTLDSQREPNAWHGGTWRKLAFNSASNDAAHGLENAPFNSWSPDHPSVTGPGSLACTAGNSVNAGVLECPWDPRMDASGTTASFSCACWVNFDQATNSQMFLNRRYAENGNFWDLGWWGTGYDSFGFYLHDSTGGICSALAAYPAVTGTWRHVAGTYDGASDVGVLYVNGAEVRRVPMALNFDPAKWGTHGLSIGGLNRAFYGFDYLLAGKLDGVCYDTRAWSSNEVRDLAASSVVPQGVSFYFDFTNRVGFDTTVYSPAYGFGYRMYPAWYVGGGQRLIARTNDLRNLALTNGTISFWYNGEYQAEYQRPFAMARNSGTNVTFFGIQTTVVYPGLTAFLFVNGVCKWRMDTTDAAGHLTYGERFRWQRPNGGPYLITLVHDGVEPSFWCDEQKVDVAFSPLTTDRTAFLKDLFEASPPVENLTFGSMLYNGEPMGGPNSYPVYGTVGRLAIYDRALTGAEITNLFRSVRFWRMKENVQDY